MRAPLVDAAAPYRCALLRAASYGKNFQPDMDPLPFVSACKKLRVLNALRNFEIGIPLTSLQYDELTPGVVIDRLLSRRQHRLALLLCDYLGLPSDSGRDKVLVNWACVKVSAHAHCLALPSINVTTLAHGTPLLMSLCSARPCLRHQVRASASVSDEAVLAVIRRKLAGVSGVSYADIAATADAAGRRRLALMLLDFEPRVQGQVPILLNMREHQVRACRALYQVRVRWLHLGCCRSLSCT
jgi:vacuolar protein sorting-associated protein 16